MILQKRKILDYVFTTIFQGYCQSYIVGSYTQIKHFERVRIVIIVKK